MKNKIVDISILTIFATILVVVGHSLPSRFEYNSSYMVFFNNLIEAIYYFHMPLFFYISGFLFSQNWSEPPFKEFILKKARRLLFPYVLLSSLGYFFKVFLSNFAMRPISPSLMDYIERLLVPWNNPVIFYWFLPTLFLTFVIFYILSKIGQNKLSITILGCLFVTTFCIFPHEANPATFLNYTGVLHNLIFFYIGMLTAGRKKQEIVFIISFGVVISILKNLELRILFTCSIIWFAHYVSNFITVNITRAKKINELASKMFFVYLFSFFIQVPVGFLVNTFTNSPLVMLLSSSVLGFWMPLMILSQLTRIKAFKLALNKVGIT